MSSGGMPVWLPWWLTLRKWTGSTRPSLSICFQLRFSASPVNSSFQPFHSRRSTTDVLFDAWSMASSDVAVPCRVSSRL